MHIIRLCVPMLHIMCWLVVLPAARGDPITFVTGMAITRNSFPGGTGTVCTYVDAPNMTSNTVAGWALSDENENLIRGRKLRPVGCDLGTPFQPPTYRGLGVFNQNLTLRNSQYGFIELSEVTSAGRGNTPEDLLIASALASALSSHSKPTGTDPELRWELGLATAMILAGTNASMQSITIASFSNTRANIKSGDFELNPVLTWSYLNMRPDYKVVLLSQGWIEGAENNSSWSLLAEILPEAEKTEQWLHVEFNSNIAGLDVSAIQKKAYEGLKLGFADLDLFETTLKQNKNVVYQQGTAAYIVPIPESTSLLLLCTGLGVIGFGAWRGRKNLRRCGPTETAICCESRRQNHLKSDNYD